MLALPLSAAGGIRFGLSGPIFVVGLTHVDESDRLMSWLNDCK